MNICRMAYSTETSCSLSYSMYLTCFVVVFFTSSPEHFMANASTLPTTLITRNFSTTTLIAVTRQLNESSPETESTSTTVKMSTGVKPESVSLNSTTVTSTNETKSMAILQTTSAGISSSNYTDAGVAANVTGSVAHSSPFQHTFTSAQVVTTNVYQPGNNQTTSVSYPVGSKRPNIPTVTDGISPVANKTAIPMTNFTDQTSQPTTGSTLGAAVTSSSLASTANATGTIGTDRFTTTGQNYSVIGASVTSVPSLTNTASPSQNISDSVTESPATDSTASVGVLSSAVTSEWTSNYSSDVSTAAVIVSTTTEFPLKLVLGLCIGLGGGVLLILIIVIIVCCVVCCRRNKRQQPGARSPRAFQHDRILAHNPQSGASPSSPVNIRPSRRSGNHLPSSKDVFGGKVSEDPDLGIDVSKDSEQVSVLYPVSPTVTATINGAKSPPKSGPAPAPKPSVGPRKSSAAEQQRCLRGRPPQLGTYFVHEVSVDDNGDGEDADELLREVGGPTIKAPAPLPPPGSHLPTIGRAESIVDPIWRGGSTPSSPTSPSPPARHPNLPVSSTFSNPAFSSDAGAAERPALKTPPLVLPRSPAARDDNNGAVSPGILQLRREESVGESSTDLTIGTQENPLFFYGKAESVRMKGPGSQFAGDF